MCEVDVLQQHTENSPLAVIEWDENLQVTRWSGRASEMFGWSSEEVVGALHLWQVTHVDDAEAVSSAIAELLSGNCSHNTFTSRNSTRSGNAIDCQWFNSVVHVDKSASILSLITDISDRKHAEEELQRSETRYRGIVEDQIDLVCRLLPDHTLTFVNESYCRYYGKSREELIGYNLLNFFPEEDREELTNYFASLTWENPVATVENKGVKPNGEICWQQWTDRALFDEQGHLIELQSVGRDITESKRADEALRLSEAQLRRRSEQLEQILHELQRTQAQLIQTEKMSGLGQLVAGVAHEINNPVNFIYGNLSHAGQYIQDLLTLILLYQECYPNPNPRIREQIQVIDLNFLIEDLPKMLSSMRMGADRIRQIVLSLRNFSRLDESEKKPVNIHEGIDSTLLILQSRLKVKPDHPDIQILKEYGDLPKVECYAGQLNQVFMNILSNAIDALEAYTSDRLDGNLDHLSTIIIRTETLDEGSRVAIRIKDNGPGMTEAVRAKLFDPFFTTKPVGQGTGLGLSISYQIIVEKHGGVLECFSQPGQGAEFVIEIPIHQGIEKLSNLKCSADVIGARSEGG